MRQIWITKITTIPQLFANTKYFIGPNIARYWKLIGKQFVETSCQKSAIIQIGRKYDAWLRTNLVILRNALSLLLLIAEKMTFGEKTER